MSGDQRTSTFSRRAFLASTAGLAAAQALTERSYADEPSRPLEFPFTLGVASGDPSPDGVVLWTRLAPDPLAEDGHGGLGGQRVPVRYQVAEDEQFTRVVRRGGVIASPELAHSVHIEVAGLKPWRWYWYRFEAGYQISPVGRTRTAAAPGADLSRMRFAFASCQDWQTGYYTAYQHMAEEDLDLVLHLGDYIYEYGSYGSSYPRPQPGGGSEADVVGTLYEYRNRYAQYKMDAHLQSVHAAFPWAVTLDDHEVLDGWADEHDTSESPEHFLERRETAFRAYYEHLPLRRSAVPHGPDLQLYRRLSYGQLAQFQVLDTRQYRDTQACGGLWAQDCDDRLDPDRSMLGARQEKWLLEGLAKSDTTWDVLAQQVFFSQWAHNGQPGLFHMDLWDGYKPARDRIINAMASRPDGNPIVISGDAHVNIASDILADFDDPQSRVVGSEFLGTAISSVGDGDDLPAWAETDLRDNPHFKFVNSRRGYVRGTMTQAAFTADYRVLPYVSRPDAPISTRSSLVVEAGHPGIQEAG